MTKHDHYKKYEDIIHELQYRLAEAHAKEESLRVTLAVGTVLIIAMAIGFISL